MIYKIFVANHFSGKPCLISHLQSIQEMDNLLKDFIKLI